MGFFLLTCSHLTEQISWVRMCLISAAQAETNQTQRCDNTESLFSYAEPTQDAICEDPRQEEGPDSLKKKRLGARSETRGSGSDSDSAAGSNRALCPLHFPCKSASHSPSFHSSQLPSPSLKHALSQPCSLNAMRPLLGESSRQWRVEGQVSQTRFPLLAS